MVDQLNTEIASIFWCCRGGLNSRPPPYQGGALPLSYGSRNPGPRSAPEAGGNCHKGCRGARIVRPRIVRPLFRPGRNCLRRRPWPGDGSKVPLSVPPWSCSGPARFAITTAMTQRRSDSDKAAPAGGAVPARSGRGERLSAALRANLVRRKVQARAREGAPPRDGDNPGTGDRAGEGSHDSAGFVAEKQTFE